MTDSVARADFPLALNPCLLCEHELWKEWRKSYQVWNASASDIRADARWMVLPYYFRSSKVSRIAGGASCQIYNYTVDLDGFKKEIHLGPQQRRAADEISASKSAALDSAKRRILRSEVNMILRPKGDILGEWKTVDPDDLRGFSFDFREPPHLRVGIRDYDFRLRDNIGLPLEQAIFVYGPPQLVRKLFDLERRGAPDHLGRLDGYPFAPEIPKEYKDAADLYAAGAHQLRSFVLERLRDGHLVGFASGGVLKADFWREVISAGMAPLPTGVVVRSAKSEEMFLTPPLNPEIAQAKRKAGRKLKIGDDEICQKIEADVINDTPLDVALAAHLPDEQVSPESTRKRIRDKLKKRGVIRL